MDPELLEHLSYDLKNWNDEPKYFRCYHHQVFSDGNKKSCTDHFTQKKDHVIHFYGNFGHYNPIEIYIDNHIIKNITFYPTDRINDAICIKFGNKLLYNTAYSKTEFITYDVQELYDYLYSKLSCSPIEGTITENFFSNLPYFHSIQYMLDKMTSTEKKDKEIIIEI